jgi:Secretion system C-terminal sorting domain
VQPAIAPAITCSPNPARDFTRLEWPGHEAVNAGIYDTQGRLLQTVVLQNGLNTIDLQAYSSGIYMVSVDNAWIRLVKM